MKKKERVEVKLAPKYAFGNLGRPDKNIPPQAHVTYDIDLVILKLILNIIKFMQISFLFTVLEARQNIYSFF